MNTAHDNQASEFDELLQQMIDGTLAEDQRNAWQQRFEKYPAELKKFIDLHGEHRLLGHILRNRDAAFTAQVMSQIQPAATHAGAASSPSRPWWRTRSLPIIGSVAAAALLMVAIRLSLFSPTEPLGWLQGPISGVQVGSVPATVGMPIFVDTPVQVTEDSTAQIRLIDGSIVDLRGGSVARIKHTNQVMTVQLIAGRAEAEVAHQAPGHHFSIEGNNATATAIGTRFIVWADQHEMHVSVTEGEVAVARHSDGNAVSLQPGQRVSIAEKSTFAVKSTPAASGEVAITSITLIDAEHHRPIPEFSPLVDGVTLDLAALPSRELNMLFAYTAGVSDVDVLLKGPEKTISRQDLCRPFTMFGNTGDYYRQWKPKVGVHHLTVTPIGYDQHDGIPYQLTFTIIDSRKP